MEPVNSNFSMTEGAASCPMTSSPDALTPPVLFLLLITLLTLDMPGLHRRSVVMEGESMPPSAI